MNDPTCSLEEQQCKSSNSSVSDISQLHWLPFSLVTALTDGHATFDSRVLMIILIIIGTMGSVVLVQRKKQLRRSLQTVPDSSCSIEWTSAMARKSDFLVRNIEAYGYRGTPGGYIDDWRLVELPSLIRPLADHDHATTISNHNDHGEIYLDYAGAALPTRSQLAAVFQELSSSTILANPHSTGPAASKCLLGIQQAKQRVLQHLDAMPGRFASLQDPPPFSTPTQCHAGYELVFTSGTTESLRLIAERFPWKAPCPKCRRQSVFLYTKNCHTSVLGMRNLATNQGARFVCRTWTELASMTAKDFDAMVQLSVNRKCDQCRHQEYPNLLAFPAECNFGGTRLDAQAIISQARGAQSAPWFTLVDIAKAASTGPVSLKDMDVDFCALSFYKLFGEPTGLGALLVKQSCTHLLQQGHVYHYQGGGSVNLMLPGQNVCIPRSEGLSALIHGSVHFRGIQTLVHGFDELDRRGGMHRIHEHATCLARELTRRLESLCHGNGQRAVVLSGAWADPTLRDTAGPVVTLNVLRDDGSFVGYNEVSKLAALYHPPMQFRTGCFCNPGACQEALQQSDEQALENFETTGHVCGDHIDLVNGRPTGAIRISFGKDSLWEDMDTFVMFLQKTFVNDSQPTSDDVRTSSGSSSRVEISELYLFPIKSCAGQRVSRWKVEMPSGKLKHDREFALVDTSGAAIRLQSCPKMTTIEPNVDLESGTMTISAPGMKDLLIRLSDGSQTYHSGDNTIKVCGNRCGGRLWGDHEVSEWFSSYLGIQCWLARFDRDGSYQMPTEQRSKDSKSSPRVGFANEQALLLISENAVSLLNGILEQQKQRPVSSRHFRPNVVVRGICSTDYHIEDDWDVLTLSRNGLKLQTKGSCARCAMVDFDPYNGKKGKTLRALAKYRRRKGQITFGVFLQALQSDVDDEWIQEGDEVVCRCPTS